MDLLTQNIIGLVRDWVASPDDELCAYYESGNRIMTQTGGGATAAVRYRPVDGERQIVIVRDDFPYGYLDGLDCQTAVVNNMVANKIFKFFDNEYMVLRGRAASDDGRSIKTAILALQELGLPLPERLDRANRCPEGFEEKGMPLLAFCDLRIPRRYRFAMMVNPAFRHPVRMQGSFIENGNFIIFESRDDAVQSKMKSDDAPIIDLWGDPPESPPVREVA